MSTKVGTKVSAKHYSGDGEGFVAAGWKLNEDDEACYIDALEDPVDPNREYSQWSDLPDLLLEEVFSYLTVQERYYASLVCSRWRDAFYLPGVWKNFIVKDKTLTRQKYNYYSGWQNVLDHLKTQQCFTRIGKYIKGLTLRPEYSFNNLFQFMSLLSWCMEQNLDIQEGTRDYIGIGTKIKTLDYIFPCNMAYTDDPESIKLFGTGGSMLVSLKRLMSNIRCLKVLKLTDLMLERYEAKHLLDEVLDTNSMNLKILHLINVTNTHCPILHVGVFLNLQVLVISPQNIDDDILQLVADGNLRHLCLYQNRYTPAGDGISSCSAKAWDNVKNGNPKLRVHLSIDSDSPDAEIVLQVNAPVYSIIYSTPNTKITATKVVRMIDSYNRTLQVYGFKNSLTTQNLKDFNERVDSLLVLICRSCPYLRHLVINEPVSSSTMLLSAHTAPNLHRLYVRKSNILLKCDWPKNPDWSDEFYVWLKNSSKKLSTTEKEISQIIGYDFKFLTDDMFEILDLDVRRL